MCSAGNALNSSATIFEALSEIDSKFAKFTDKEYDNISSEVKKWFKKLAVRKTVHTLSPCNSCTRSDDRKKRRPTTTG